MEQEQFEKAEQFMVACMEATVHDTAHVYRVLYMAAHLAETELLANREVVLLAALLHDIGRSSENEELEGHHAVIGAKMAKEFLLENGWEQPMADHVAECIRTHSYSHKDKPLTVEAQIVFDADKLDLSGAIGAARAIAYGAKIEEPLYKVGAGGMPLAGSLEEEQSLFKEYSQKLSQMDNLFFTREAKRIGAKRQKTMDFYFRKLKNEVDECYGTGRSLLHKWLEDDE